MTDYAICAAAEGKSKHSIAIVSCSVRYLTNFLKGHGATTDALFISATHLRAFSLYLSQKPCFEDHPFTPPQEKGLSGHTINTYLRSIRGFFSWLVQEEILEKTPFDRVKVPRVPRKVIPTFSEGQIRQLLSVIDIALPIGCRDHTMILVMLDCGLRVSELVGLEMARVSLEEGTMTVLGKGNKERSIPMGRQVVRQLARYMGRHRPEPATCRMDQVFLTVDGWPLSKDRVENIMRRYGRKAKIEGVRCSPHTLRHTAAVSFIRNGGDAFSLQKLLGHTSLDMTRRYCELADVDLKRAHHGASPVDNLGVIYRSRPGNHFRKGKNV